MYKMTQTDTDQCDKVWMMRLLGLGANGTRTRTPRGQAPTINVLGVGPHEIAHGPIMWHLLRCRKDRRKHSQGKRELHLTLRKWTKCLEHKCGELNVGIITSHALALRLWRLLSIDDADLVESVDRR